MSAKKKLSLTPPAFEKGKPPKAIRPLQKKTSYGKARGKMPY